VISCCCFISTLFFDVQLQRATLTSIALSMVSADLAHAIAMQLGVVNAANSWRFFQQQQ
jgi:hypothetical protein